MDVFLCLKTFPHSNVWAYAIKSKALENDWYNFSYGGNKLWEKKIFCQGIFWKVIWKSIIWEIKAIRNYVSISLNLKRLIYKMGPLDTIVSYSSSLSPKAEVWPCF